MILPDEGADGPSSPKAMALPPTLKRALPEKGAQLGLQSVGSANRSTQDGELAPTGNMDSLEHCKTEIWATCLLPHLTSSSVCLFQPSQTPPTGPSSAPTPRTTAPSRPKTRPLTRPRRKRRARSRRTLARRRTKTLF